MKVKERYFMMDFYGIDRLTIETSARWIAEKEYYNKFGYMPDIIKIIDEIGGVIEILKY